MAIKDIPLPDWEDFTDLLGLELDEPGGLDLLDPGGYVGEQAYEQLRPDPWAEADPWAAPLAGGIAGLLPIGAAFGLPDIPGVELTRLARALKRAPVIDPAFTKAIESLRKSSKRGEGYMNWAGKNAGVLRKLQDKIDKMRQTGIPAFRRWSSARRVPPGRTGDYVRGPVSPSGYTTARGESGLAEETLTDYLTDRTIQAVRKAGYTRKQTGELMKYLTKKVKQAQDELWKKR